jgi:gamma-carbonic anhydrase
MEDVTGRHRGRILPFAGVRPRIDARAFLAEQSTIVGDVVIGAESSVWFGAVIRGDVFPIRVGARTSIQDNSVLHVTAGQHATQVGDRVTVGHSVTLHGCTVEDLCIIGMGSIVLDRAVVESRCIIGAGAVLTPGTRVPSGHLALGSPARVIRPPTPAELHQLEESAAHYVALIEQYCPSL